MFDRVTIPLVLRAPADDRLVFTLPVWYRVMMTTMLAVLVAALAMDDARPGVLGLVVVALVALAALYEERWTLDGASGQVVHRAGLLFAARRQVIPMAAIEQFRLAPHVEGTIPGSEDERRENAAALRGARGDDADLRRARHKRPFLGLVLECSDGAHYLVDRVPARNAARLREAAGHMADLCGKPLTD